MKKNEKMLLSLGDIDVKYIEQANAQKKKLGILPKVLITAAACYFIMITSAAMILFFPFRTTPPDVSKYSSSEYYGIIQKLNEATYKKPKYKNNFELISANIVGMFRKIDGMTGSADNMTNAPEDMMYDGEISDVSGSYVEATDNQVAGVIEADLIKRSDKYIYYLNSDTLRIFSIEGEDSKAIGEYKLNFNNATQHPHTSEIEMYLSSDCKTITVIAPYYGKSKESQASDSAQAMLALISLDVSDPKNITERSRVDITGSYLSSRLVDGKLLLMSSYRVSDSIDFDDKSTYIPQLTTSEGTEYIPFDNIAYPDALSSTMYTVVYLFDHSTLTAESSAAFLSYSNEVYVSKSNIYATRAYQAKEKIGANQSLNTTMTEIGCLSYSQGKLTHLGSVSVKGYVNDQYSLDEYEGILRVVTTTSSYLNYENNGIIDATDLVLPDVVSSVELSGTNASLYCIDISKWDIIAKVENFAPVGETVRSVRFDGDTAYVCTSIMLSDPVFFFDLSDLSSITYKDTGTIDGFSSSLVNFGNGYLLGIGRSNSWTSVKIEIYKETETGVESVCSYEFENANYSAYYKSFFIDRKNGLVGLGIKRYDLYGKDANRYVLLFFDGYDLRVAVNEHLSGANEAKRALYIDGYFYMFGEDDFKVVPLI